MDPQYNSYVMVTKKNKEITFYLEKMTDMEQKLLVALIHTISIGRYYKSQTMIDEAINSLHEVQLMI